MNFIKYYDDILTAEECEQLVNQSKILYENPREDNFGVRKTTGKNNRFYYRIHDNLYTKQQITVVENALKNIYEKYQKDFTLLNDYSKITHKWKVHYNPKGGYIDWHNDLGGKEEEAWRRKIVFIIYLNDMIELDGSLIFKYFPDVQIQPKAGRVLIMPTGWAWTHKAEEVSFDKYILTGFYYDKEDKC